MIASNYQDVIDQLHAAGLEGRGIDDDLIIGRMARCQVKGDREKRGWYALHELRTETGDTLLVGGFGVWQGNENNAQKIELRKTELSIEQRASLRRRLAEDRKRADAARRAEADRAARHATAAWSKCEATGESEYLTRKGVAAHGIRFSPSGAIAIPMLDVSGRIHGLQIIRGRNSAKGALEKEFWPRGLVKKGHFHLIGVPEWIVLIAEGYATGASLHEATGYPVAIAFDAGNLQAVAAALHKRYKRVRILVCADDDSLQKCHACGERVLLATHPKTCPHCDAAHGAVNAGVAAASSAALEVAGAWVAPQFADEAGRRARFLDRGIKLTDFNDLHKAEGLHVVRTQVEFRLGELGWTARMASARVNHTTGEGEAPLRSIETLDELLERYALVYGQRSTVFDRQEHTLVTMTDMRDACTGRQLHRAWAEHPDRAIVRAREVGFDPAGTDPSIKCNLWSGWPTVPKSGSCEKLLELLRYMCSAEGEANELYEWVLAWIAYPIQHPGAKLKTTLVVHGPQGTGKNLFFETVMAIYDHYGRVIDQTALEDKFNDWASRKLFLIADEVVARSDLYHVKNKLKAFITGDWIRINPKNMAAYDERNHVNMVFLSNESMPVVLDQDDRRHAVIWTPDKLDQAFYRAVLAEIEAGGVAALHDYLLHHDCGAFNPGTPPPDTDAKRELVNQSLDSTSRFFIDIINGDVPDIALKAALSLDFYDAYRIWCVRTGVRCAPINRLLNVLQRRHKVRIERKRYETLTGIAGPHSIVMLTFDSCPPGANETSWLGAQVSAFRESLKAYKGAVHV